MNILLADDQSRDARAAARLLARLQPEDGSRLVIAYVNELGKWPDFETSGRALGMPHEIETVRRETTERARVYLERVARSFTGRNLAVRSAVLEGLPGQEILAAIEREHIDLAVMGTRGRTGLKRFLLGSTSEKIVTHAQASVLIARSASRRSGGRSPGGLRLLVCLDASAEALATIEFLQRFRLPPSSRFVLLHVVESKTPAVRPHDLTGSGTKYLSKQILDVGKRIGRQLLGETATRLRDATVTQALATGDPADEILKTAAKTRADLVVMGARGLTGWQRFLMGSVSARVVRHAPCSVLVVRGAAAR